MRNPCLRRLPAVAAALFCGMATVESVGGRASTTAAFSRESIASKAAGTSDDRTIAPSAESQRRQGTVDDPRLVRLGEAICNLLETGDVEAFVREAAVSLDDWKTVLPERLSPEDHPLGKDSEERIKLQQSKLSATAHNVIDMACRAGLNPGQMRFRVRTVNSIGGARAIYKIAGRSLEIPYQRRARVILAGEPVTDGKSGKPWSGDYQLCIGEVREFSAGWHIQDGIRWLSFPAGVADESMRRELALMNAIGDDMLRGETISGLDDEALIKFGEAFVDLLHRRSVVDFIGVAVMSREDWKQRMWQTVQRYDSEEVDRVRQQVHAGASKAAQAFLDQLDRLGIDLSDAQISLKQVIAENTLFLQFGVIEGLQSRTVRLSLGVQSARQSRAGKPVSGDYVVTVKDACRTGGRWVLAGDRICWQEFPAGLLTRQDLEALEFENYVVENGSFPPRAVTPDVEMGRLDNDARVRLADFRGKLVLLEFWATSCGACQEPMAKLQTLRGRHPEWKDRVEIITVSLDEKRDVAREHLEKQGWTKTLNLWAGDEGWSSDVARKFRIRSIPLLYLLDRDGRVLAGKVSPRIVADLIAAQLQ